MRLFVFSLFVAAAALVAVPSADACNGVGVPASNVAYAPTYRNTCQQQTYQQTYQTYATTYYALPLAYLPVVVPTVTIPVQPTQPAPSVPESAPQPQAAIPQAAPAQALTVQVPQAAIVVQRQVYSSYLTPAQAIINYGTYDGGATTVLRQFREYAPSAAIVLHRGVRAVSRAPVFVERRFAPIRNRIARKQAAKANGGVPAAQVFIRR